MPSNRLAIDRSSLMGLLEPSKINRSSFFDFVFSPLLNRS
jgi:hypothetical protein